MSSSSSAAASFFGFHNNSIGFAFNNYFFACVKSGENRFKPLTTNTTTTVVVVAPCCSNNTSTPAPQATILGEEKTTFKQLES